MDSVGWSHVTATRSNASVICAPASRRVCRLKTQCWTERSFAFDPGGRSVFSELMFRRQLDCHFFAFDLLFVNGEDLRTLPLFQRKRRLRKLIPGRSSRLFLSGSHRTTRV